jgi:hypothetical protein
MEVTFLAHKLVTLIFVRPVLGALTGTFSRCILATRTQLATELEVSHATYVRELLWLLNWTKALLDAHLACMTAAGPAFPDLILELLTDAMNLLIYVTTETFNVKFHFSQS